MKLLASVPLAKVHLNTLPLTRYERQRLAFFINNALTVIPHHDMHTLRRALWARLSDQVRCDILAESVGYKDFVGTYSMSVREAHVDALLRKVLPHSVLAKQITWAKLYVRP